MKNETNEESKARNSDSSDKVSESMENKKVIDIEELKKIQELKRLQSMSKLDTEESRDKEKVTLLNGIAETLEGAFYGDLSINGLGSNLDSINSNLCDLTAEMSRTRVLISEIVQILSQSLIDKRKRDFRKV